MNTSTKKWILLKASSLVLLPLMMWFILNFSFIALSDPIEIISLLTSQPGKILFSVFIIVAFFFFSLTISEIFEDYINSEKTRKFANMMVYLSSFIIPTITIFTLYKL